MPADRPAPALSVEEQCPVTTRTGNTRCQDRRGHGGYHVSGTGTYWGADGIERCCEPEAREEKTR